MRVSEMTKADLIATVRYARLDSKATAFERDEARERAGNLSVELAAMTLERDELRQEIKELKRVFGCTERERKNALKRAWSAESSLTIRRSLCRDIAVALGCEGMEGDESLKAGLDAIRALKQGKEGAR